MSSISPFNTTSSSNSEAIYAAGLTPASAASKSNAGSASPSVSAATQDIEDTVQLSRPDARELFQLGRISYQQQAGKLTSAEGTQLDSLVQQLQTAVQSDISGNGGSLTGTQATNINQLQNGLSKEIYADANDLSNGSNFITPPAVPST